MNAATMRHPGPGNAAVAAWPHRCRGVMLLEVILALAILLMGMAAIGIQLRTSIATGYENDRMTRALMLAEAKLSQLDSGAINLDRELGADGVMEGDFGKSFPGFFWRFTFEPHDDFEELFTVDVEILFGAPHSDLEPGDIEDADRVLTLHLLRATPPVLDLRRDFGFSEEQMEEVAEILPPDLDPSDLSPAFINELGTEELMAIMPMLMQLFGQGFGFSAEHIQQAIDQGVLDPGNLPTGGLEPGQLQGLPDLKGGDRRRPEQ